MKKGILKWILSGVFLVSSGVTFAAKPIPHIEKEVLARMTDAEKEATLLNVQERLLEIKSLDKSQLSKEEKKSIRIEKKNAKAIAAGLDRKVSISIGAIIIAILLILLIF